MTEQDFLAIASGEDRRLRACALRGVLACLAQVYALGAGAKNWMFAVGFKQAQDLGRPTVSIGNLTTGGTGKTPMVAWVAKQLAAQGHRPCILLRGYRAKNGVSDEAEELRGLVGDVAQVAPHPDRVAEAKRQLAAHPDITCFILDDGFQHRRAKRDLDLVLVDATNPWGYGHCLPRGLLRENKQNLRRADAVVVTRCDRVESEALAQIEAEIQALAGRPPLALARHGWEGFKVWKDGSEEGAPWDALRGEKAAAVCGIGNPAAFLAQARTRAGALVLERPMADHFAWDAAALDNLFGEAQVAGASAVLTTEKDFVKWRVYPRQLRLPVFRPVLAMQFPQGGNALPTLLASRIPLLSHAP